MSARRTIRMAALLCVAFPATALSEVYECEGKWTNKPCDGTVTRRLDSEPLDSAPSDPNAGLKHSFFHQLRLKSIDAQKQYGVGVDLSAAEHACISQALDLDGCRSALKAADTELEKKIQDAAHENKTRGASVDPGGSSPKDKIFRGTGIGGL